MKQLRRGNQDDLAAIHAVWWAADPAEAGHSNPWFGHVLRTGTMMLATVDSDGDSSVIGSDLIGFAGLREVDATQVVSDCFIHPDYQGQGIGSRLLEQLIAENSPVMTMASSDPKARSLYSKFGMKEQWPCHYLEGDPRQLRRIDAKAGEVHRYPISESDLIHLRDDLGCRFLEVGSGAVAVSSDSVESSRVTSSIEAVSTLVAACNWMADRGNEFVSIHMAEQHPAFPLLVGAGFRITATDTVMASKGAEVPDPARLTFNGDMLQMAR